MILAYAGFSVGSSVLTAMWMRYRSKKYLRRALDARDTKSDQKLKERELWHWQMQKETLVSMLESFAREPVHPLKDLATRISDDWNLILSDEPRRTR